MGRKRLLWQLFPSYLLITLISLVAITLYATNELRQFYHDRTADDLRARALLIDEDVRRRLLSGRSETVDALCKEYGEKASTRITVILTDGKVVGDTDSSPETMENHGDRAEVEAALNGRAHPSIRFSDTLKQQMMYVAIPVEHDGATLGVLRMAIPLTMIDDALRTIHWHILAGGLVVALAAAGISLLISRKISRPLEQLKRGAERFARGDLDHKLPVGDSYEIGALAEALNQMAAELDDRMRAVLGQRNEREAILSSMVEGVLAVDLKGRLISLNQAGARLIGVEPQAVHGRTLQEAVRNEQLETLVDEVLSSQQPMEKEIALYENEQRYLQAYGTVLRDASPQPIGVLLVLHDVTRIKRLERVRQDFVANVSHELKTPVTSIKGFVETLLDGAMQDAADTQRFLKIVATQADRLGAIIDDLLDLSRIEQEAERAEIVLTPVPVKNVLETAIELCRPKASKKQIEIELTCDDRLQTAINPPLLEQAVVNLIDNAVKYSPAGQPIHVEADRERSEVVVRVRDHGCGIGAEHLPRIFERFYRVDKARSRKLGGTGLGLAIVKHIAQAHGGRATVQSTPEVGSTFAVHLPDESNPSPA